MSPKEIVLAAIKGEEIPRYPVIPYISQFATVYQGVNYTKFSQDGDLIADVLLKTAEEFDYDGVYVSTDSGIEMGFENMFGFSRSFKRQFKLSPREYRKRH